LKPDPARHRMAAALSGIALILLTGCSCQRHPAVPVYQPAILASVAHDTNAFTQGLLIDGKLWLESTGGYGQSDLREVDRSTGQVLRSTPLPRNLFGEGLALFNGKLYLLTWREGLCLVYDRETLKATGHFAYTGEGWGLANCDKWLYMSNGSSTIQVRDPVTFKVMRTITVHSNLGPVTGLNELEWIEGEIWANIFPSNDIVRFNPDSGAVSSLVNLEHLPLPGDVHPGQDVLNGIAYDPADKTVWVTGKNWSRIYQIAWPPPDAPANTP
jgi:glutaminyl-peptide cyclotransferase